MDRREFLVATGSALAATSLAHPACATTPSPSARQLTLSVADADGMGWTMVQAHSLARRIEQLSAQTVAISVVDEASATPADLSLATASALVDRDNGFAFATGLPGNQALDAAALDVWLTNGGGQPLLDDLAAVHGLKVLVAAHTGPSFLWSQSPITKAEHFAGKAVHADGLARSVAAGLGAEPWRILSSSSNAQFAAGELTAVEASVIDAMSSQLLQHARYATSSALAPQGTAAALTIQLGVWKALTAADRAMITQAARANYLETVSLNRAYETLNRNALAQSFGIAIAPASAQLSAAVQSVSRAMVAAAAATSIPAQVLNASYMSFLMNPLNSNGENRYV